MKKDLALSKKIDKEILKKIEFNHNYWENNAKKHKDSHKVSWGDRYIIDLEIENVSTYISNGDVVLDAGCSNGYSTFKISKNKKIKVRAFDYSKKSILHANKTKRVKDKKNKIDFYHANILEIPEKDNFFDKAYTIRVIINLLSWKLQKESILEIYRVLKPGGLYIMSEAFIGSLKNINSLRKVAGMSPLEVHDFNLYLEEKKLEKFLNRYFEIVEIRKFSSVYYAASRFLRYLTLNKKSKDSFINSFNKYFAEFKETENSGDFGIQKIYVLRKK
jgi:ubiquinone/menaquinone biosynthesis C-methylase UbiE